MITKILIFLLFFFQGVAAFAQSEALRNIETLILKESYHQAARECEKILDHSRRASTKSKAYYLLGICLLKEARFAEARKNFQKILRRYSRSRFYDDASVGIADSYFLAGDYKQAGKKYEQFLQDFPRSELASIAQMQLKLCKQGGAFTDAYFSVQVGCFADKSNAEKLREELIDAGFQAQILKSANENLYRIRVGRFTNRLEAELLEQRLKTQGYPTKVYP